MRVAQDINFCLDWSLIQQLLSTNMCRSFRVCQSSNLQLTMSYSGAYTQQVGVGSHGVQRRTTAASGIQALGHLPGHSSMAASARGVGSYLSHRPGVTHLENPSTAAAIR